MSALSFGSLFTGIGGLDLGLERAGMRCAFQVEIDDYATRILEKHWPRVHRFRDVRAVRASEAPRIDMLAGGFPCQDISRSGLREGIDGARSGLWGEFRRLIRELRPRMVIVENVPGLFDSGLGRVLGDLAQLGFDAEWTSISACSVGAPHLRARVFIVAYPQGEHGPFGMGPWGSRERPISSCGNRTSRKAWLESEPSTGGVAHGLSNRVDRLRCLGNAVVPQVAEFVGRIVAGASHQKKESAT